MKVLIIHARKFAFEIKSKALPNPEPRDKIIPNYECENCLVVFVSVEKRDIEEIDGILIELRKDLEKLVENLKPRSIVLYPYAHLSSDLAAPSHAIKVLTKAEELLKDRFEAYEVIRAPFGWYKSFEISCPGHPLSELSRSYPSIRKSSETKELRKCRIMYPNGLMIEPDREAASTVLPKELVNAACFGRQRKPKINSKVVEVLKKFGIYIPTHGDSSVFVVHGKACTMRNIIISLSIRSVEKLAGVYEEVITGRLNVGTTEVVDHPILNHLEAFNTGLIQSLTKSRALIEIRHATIPVPSQLFPTFSEVTATIVGLSQNEAVTMAREIVKKTVMTYDELGLTYAITLRKPTNELAKELSSATQKPMLIIDGDTDIAEFAVKVLGSDTLGNVISLHETHVVSTHNNLKNTEQDKVFAVITNLLGPIEPLLYLILDHAGHIMLKGETPAIPTWLSPIQARVIPVKEEHVNYGMEVVSSLTKSGIRADIDLRDTGLGKRIREAGREWIPYVVVVGDREVSAGTVNVRIRSEGRQVSMSIDELKARILSEVPPLLQD